MREGDEGEKENWRNAKEGGGGRAFPPSHVLYSQSGFHPPSHQQPWLKKPICKLYTHIGTNTHSSCQKASFDSNHQSTFWHHTKPLFMHFVATGSCLKRNIEKPKKVSSNYSQNEPREPAEYWSLSSLRDKAKKMINCLSCEIKRGTHTGSFLRPDREDKHEHLVQTHVLIKHISCITLTSYNEWKFTRYI